MSESKTFILPDGGQSGSMMPLLASLCQQRGVDPNVLLAMRGGNGWGGNGIDIIVLLFLFMLFNNNGFGFGNQNGNLPNLINNDAGRELLMSAIQGNGNAIGESERGSESKARRFLRRQWMQPVGRHRENTEVVIGIIGGVHLLSLFCGGSRNLWRLSATLASATLSVPPSRSRQGFKPNLPRYIAAAAKQDCTSKSDNQSPISGTGECGHITHGHSTPTLAQKLVGGVT